MKQFGLGKKERVKSEIVSGSLFTRQAQALSCQGFRFNWIILTTAAAGSCQVMFLGPKKKLPHATQRNRRKRLLRELYRLNKLPLLQKLSALHLGIAMSIHYTGTAELDFHRHQPSFQKALSILTLDIEKNYTSTLPAAH